MASVEHNRILHVGVTQRNTEMELLLLKEHKKVCDILDRVSEMVIEKRNQPNSDMLDNLIKAQSSSCLVIQFQIL